MRAKPKRVPAVIAVIAALWTAAPASAASRWTAGRPPGLSIARHGQRADGTGDVGSAVPQGASRGAIDATTAPRLTIRQTTGLIGSLPGPRPRWIFWIIVIPIGVLVAVLMQGGH